MICSCTCSKPSMFLAAHREPFKAWHGRRLAVGWPARPGLPGTFLVLALTVPCPGNPSLPGKLGQFVIRPMGSDRWLCFHPHLLYSVVLPSQVTCPIAWPSSFLPPRLCPSFPLPGMRPHLPLSAGLTCLCESLLSHLLCEPPHCLLVSTASVDVWDL